MDEQPRESASGVKGLRASDRTGFSLQSCRL